MKEKDAILLRHSDARGFAETLRLLGGDYDCVVAGTIEESRDILTRKSIPAMIVWSNTSDADSVAFCRALYRSHPEIKTILVSGGNERLCLIEAFNDNCLFRCLAEPVLPDTLMTAVRAAVRRFEMDRVQNLLVERATEIDRQIHSLPYWLYRLRTSLSSLLRVIAGSVGLCVIMGIVLLLAGMGVLLLLYYIKSALGIDVFGDEHLKDFFSP